MKPLALLAIPLCMAAASAQAQQAYPHSITIVSDPAAWYADTSPQQEMIVASGSYSTRERILFTEPVPSPEAFLEQPHITSLPGPIPQSWHVTRLDPQTRARVVWLDGQWAVVTWGSSRVMPNWHDYRTRFSEMAAHHGPYSRDELPADHAARAEFHHIDANHDGVVSEREHNRFFKTP